MSRTNENIGKIHDAVATTANHASRLDNNYFTEDSYDLINGCLDEIERLQGIMLEKLHKAEEKLPADYQDEPINWRDTNAR
jgi:hypothetical protein